MPTNPPFPLDQRKLDPWFAALATLQRERLKDMIRTGERGPSSGPRERAFAPAALDREESALFAAQALLGVPPREAAPLCHGLRLEGDQILASVFVQHRCARGRLEQLGAKVRSHGDTVSTAEIALDRLPALAADPDIDFIELSRPVHPQLDKTIPMLRADRLHRARPPITGSGIVLGVVDCGGLDFHHPDFSAVDGGARRTRIAYLWDQRAERDHAGAGRVPAPWSYGVEYSAAEIDEDLRSGAPYSVVQSRPHAPPGKISHGTHMAGIAAGNGSASGGRYAGVAPEAEIIFVNTCSSGTRGFADMTCVCDAITYVVERAGERPCVINLSMGDNLGPHDGSSLAERFLDDAVGKAGRAVVVAAGNHNSHGLHAEVVVPAEGAAVLELRVPPSIYDGESIEIWYPGDDRLDLELSVPGPHGGRARVGAGEACSVQLGLGSVEVRSVLHDRRNGDNVIHLTLVPDELIGRLADGVWRLSFLRSARCPAPAPPGTCHAWIDGNASYIRWMQPTEGHCTLTTPGTARGAIVVGNYMARLPAGISATSGRGPTRDGRWKPDVAAPGTAITAALASETPERRGDLYMSGCGTSQAAAHVSGLLALLFQRFGAELPVDEVKSLLRDAADDAQHPGVWDPGAGWGVARAPAAPPAERSGPPRHDGCGEPSGNAAPIC